MTDRELRDAERRWRETGDARDRDRLRQVRTREGRAFVLELLWRSERAALQSDGEPHWVDGHQLQPPLEEATHEWGLVVFDLSGLPIVYSFVIGALLDTQSRITRRGGRVVLGVSNEHVRLVFELLGLAEQFVFYESVPQALAAEGWTEAGRGQITWHVED